MVRPHAQATRRGYSMIEVCVAVGIMAILIGFLLVAVQRVRQSAMRTDTANRLRQLALAAGHYQSDMAPKRLPGQTVENDGGGLVFWELLPYLDASYRPDQEVNTIAERLYRSPADPSFAFVPNTPPPLGNCSFAVNSMASRRQLIFDELPDGTASTVLFAERYARCYAQHVVWSATSAGPCYHNGQLVPCPASGVRRATFGDSGYVDLVPVRKGQEPYTYPRIGFQVAPAVPNCDGRLVQASGPGGLLTAFADGSVHTISPGVVPAVFWGLVTPDGGEVPSDW